MSDNGRQFDNAFFKDFCEHFGIQNHYSSPAHPQANGQAEVANRSLLKIIKTRLERANGVWPDELSGVLWAYKTTVKTPTRETPFKLAYGSEAVIPTKVHMANYSVTMYQDKDNEEQLRLNLDLIDEVRTDADKRMTRYNTSWEVMGSYGLIGKDLTELSTVKGKGPTTWKPWTGGS